MDASIDPSWDSNDIQVYCSYNSTQKSITVVALIQRGYICFISTQKHIFRTCSVSPFCSMGIFPPCCTEVLEKMLEMVCGKQHDVPRESDSSNQTSSIKIKGTVVLRKKNVLNFKDAGSAFLDRMHELFGKRVILQLISADPGNLHFLLELSKEMQRNLLVIILVRYHIHIYGYHSR